MRRRRLLLLFGGATVTWPLAAPLATIADAQKRPRISILHSGFPNRTPIHLLLEALGALGYEDGSTATIELLGGEGNADRLNALVAHRRGKTRCNYCDHLASCARAQAGGSADAGRVPLPI